MSDDNLRRYLNEINKYPLLTEAEEILLGKSINLAKAAEEKLDSGFFAESKEQLEKIISEGKDAVKKLINANYRLVVSIANKIKSNDFELLDLIQEGNIGLVMAAKRFDYSLGNKFSTFAASYIEGYILTAIRDNGTLIKYSREIKSLYFKVKKAKDKYLSKNGESPSLETLSKTLDVSVSKLKQVESLIMLKGSLDKDIKEESPLIEMIKDNNPTAEDIYEENTFINYIDKCLKKLDSRKELILRYRFGFDGKSYTLKALAEEFNISVERVRQIEAEALEELKEFL